MKLPNTRRRRLDIFPWCFAAKTHCDRGGGGIGPSTIPARRLDCGKNRVHSSIVSALQLHYSIPSASVLGRRRPPVTTITPTTAGNAPGLFPELMLRTTVRWITLCKAEISQIEHVHIIAKIWLISKIQAPLDRYELWHVKRHILASPLQGDARARNIPFSRHSYICGVLLGINAMYLHNKDRLPEGTVQQNAYCCWLWSSRSAPPGIGCPRAGRKQKVTHASEQNSPAVRHWVRVYFPPLSRDFAPCLITDTL